MVVRLVGEPGPDLGGRVKVELVRKGNGQGSRAVAGRADDGVDQVVKVLEVDDALRLARRVDVELGRGPVNVLPVERVLAQNVKGAPQAPPGLLVVVAWAERLQDVRVRLELHHGFPAWDAPDLVAVAERL